MSAFDKAKTFGIDTPLDADVVYVNRVAESPVHHDIVGCISFVPVPKQKERYLTLGEFACYDAVTARLRAAGYIQASAAKANSSKAAAKYGNAFIPTLTEVWVRHE